MRVALIQSKRKAVWHTRDGPMNAVEGCVSVSPYDRIAHVDVSQRRGIESEILDRDEQIRGDRLACGGHEQHAGEDRRTRKRSHEPSLRTK